VVIIAPKSISTAQNEITVLLNTTDAQFPVSLTFNLEAKSDFDITDVVLRYRVDKMNVVPITSVVKPKFTPAPDVDVTWTWDMERTGGLPPGTEIEYKWKIENSAGDETETQWKEVSFEDQSHNWNSVTKEDTSLFWYEGSEDFAQELLDAAAEAQKRLVENTDAHPERSVRIYIYASQRDLLQAMIYPQEWTGGVALPDFGVVVIAVAPGDFVWGERVLAHEMTHIVVHQMVFSPFSDLPTWLDEGIAVYNEGEPRSDLMSAFEKAISEDKLISVQTLSSSFPTDPEKARLSYAESWSLVKFLLDTFGREKMLNLLLTFKEGATYDDALLDVYNFDTSGLETLWRANLGLKYEEESPFVPVKFCSGVKNEV
jgi:hypothetical protein